MAAFVKHPAEEPVRLTVGREALTREAALEVVVAEFAHDLNNLLTIVHGNSFFVLGRRELGDEVRQAMEEIRGATSRAATLTKGLIAAVLGQSPERTDLDLDELARGMMPVISGLLGEGVSISFVGQELGSPVRADAMMMDRLLLDLVTNARDAMPTGGHILVRTDTVSPDGSTTAARADEERAAVRFVRLSVIDEGHGIEPSDLPRIFDPFFTANERGRGRGLGLATVQRVVARHGGWIEVESRSGCGATFSVFLPKYDASTRDATPRPPPNDRARAAGPGDGARASLP